MNRKKPHDALYANPHEQLVDFEFNEAVARVFPDMIRRSVPGYGTLITLLGLLAEEYARPGSNIYDLGSSLGAATLAMRRRIPHHDCRIIAVDNSAAMVERCRSHVAEDLSPIEVETRCADIRDIEFQNASIVVLNFTLQFLPPRERTPLLQKIHAGLLPGGALVLSEKIAFADAGDAQLLDRLHLAFKKANGYSALEISQKRSALENVLVPETLPQHHQRLKETGFRHSHSWFQCMNFASILAVK
ncbi:tRNA (cmo5U34)-methyltransferase [Candidatus Tenderia electrophaga]|jgi:tRNA (cmo5U34)-methyltransferase|uniref:Carboxy-S-adenosyl-L-methionine synthase n=1 Tax=Candidatus Tenderia electrophaga TaxID=1748243 RepID=A0A0S2TH42_9GAMM|nr:tRNA (cmo5U34)-methyltransferase [Candidatus Tenderia electrophaga]